MTAQKEDGEKVLLVALRNVHAVCWHCELSLNDTEVSGCVHCRPLRAALTAPAPESLVTCAKPAPSHGHPHRQLASCVEPQPAPEGTPALCRDCGYRHFGVQHGPPAPKGTPAPAVASTEEDAVARFVAAAEEGPADFRDFVPGVPPPSPAAEARCPKPVHVDDGWPLGHRLHGEAIDRSARALRRVLHLGAQCLRPAGHNGLCAVYDGREDAERKPAAVADLTRERIEELKRRVDEGCDTGDIGVGTVYALLASWRREQRLRDAAQEYLHNETLANEDAVRAALAYDGKEPCLCARMSGGTPKPGLTHHMLDHCGTGYCPMCDLHV